jgi:hypothetical protein
MSTSWLNMSEGWRRSALVAVRRGPTQQEAQEARADRERRRHAAGGNLIALQAIKEEASRWNAKAGERRVIA